MYTQKIYKAEECSACYFRSVAAEPYKKALLQITERCNLKCKHCFVSSTTTGRDMSFQEISEKILPFLLRSNVKKVTLTGGEPFVYPHLLDLVKLLAEHEIGISICTNATGITEGFLEQIAPLEHIHFNVSLDGFSSRSHGSFRGINNSRVYDNIIANIKLLGRYGLLNGILVTPNKYSSIDEYCGLCEFAKENHAKYVLMNPLSQFGRGEDTSFLGFTQEQMTALQERTQEYQSDSFEVVYIRFPNIARRALSSCMIGKIYYIFSNGDLATCPYMAFASSDHNSKYDKRDFILGNVFQETFDAEERFQTFIRRLENMSTLCDNCTVPNCGRGCYAAKIAIGSVLEDRDAELCPLVAPIDRRT